MGEVLSYLMRHIPDDIRADIFREAGLEREMYLEYMKR